MQSDFQRRRSEKGAERDRGCDKNGIPDDPAADFKSGHAGIVHDGNAAADNRSAKPGCAGKFRKRNRKTNSRQDDGCNERKESEAEIVAGRNARGERQHGDEMRRPDAEAGRGCRHGEPRIANKTGRLAHIVQQRNGCKRRERANDRSQNNEPEVVLVHNAIVNGQHVVPTNRVRARPPGGAR